MAKPVMVFHAPFPLQENPTAASALRPVKMLQAFENLGYRVWRVTGYAEERRRSIRSLQSAIRRGLNVQFVYSESATIPTSFTEPRHFPLRPFLDADFFRFLHERHIPIGVFYRDVYWAFPEYRERVGAVVSTAMRALYLWDIAAYNKYVSVLFVPSEEMAQHIPARLDTRIVALPPGADYAPAQEKSEKSEVRKRPLQVLYVGGANRNHYDLAEAFRAFDGLKNSELTVCTPAETWEEAKGTYDVLPENNLRVVHRSAGELDDLYEGTDCALLFVRPHEYRDFAVPVKLFEYFGRGKPVIASEGTMAARIVSETGAGWVIPYSADSLTHKLAELSADRSLLVEPTACARQAGTQNTWEARARAAAETLTV